MVQNEIYISNSKALIGKITLSISQNILVIIKNSEIRFKDIF